MLDVYFQELSPNRYLEEKITNSILSEEEIADAASSELADIRRHMRIQSAKVKDSLQKIISSPSFSKYLQRTQSSRLRGDRYVVPVKSEYKSDDSRPGPRCVLNGQHVLYRADVRPSMRTTPCASC